MDFNQEKTTQNNISRQKTVQKITIFFSNTTFDTAQCYARDDFYAYDS